MKKILITATAIFLALSQMAFSQVPALFNNGAGLYIASGTQVRINGNFTNGLGSTLENNGAFTISGDVTNNIPMNEADAGELILVGSSRQTFTGTALYATNVTVSNPAGILLQVPLKVSGLVNFVSGILTNNQQANAVNFSSTASVSSTFLPSDNSHIDGFVVKEGEGSFTFPIGDGLTYQPVAVDLTENNEGIVAKYEVGDAGEAPYATTGSSSTPLVARNAQEYWTLTPINTASGTVTVFWDDYNNTGISNINDLTIAHLYDSKWQNEGANDQAGNVVAGSVTSNIISNWSPFTLGSIAPSSPLPVKLISFKAQKAENAAELSWRIADAVNFSHFEIERSTDAVQFEKIGRIEYVNEQQPDYQYTDWSMAVSPGPRYYRLRLVDMDGTFAFSKMESLDSGNRLLGFTAYPNPSKDKITVKIDGEPSTSIDIIVTSSDGRQLIRRTIKLVQGKAIVDTSSLPTGVYLLATRLNEGDHVIKFAKN